MKNNENKKKQIYRSDSLFINNNTLLFVIIIDKLVIFSSVCVFMQALGNRIANVSCRQNITWTSDKKKKVFISGWKKNFQSKVKKKPKLHMIDRMI